MPSNFVLVQGTPISSAVAQQLQYSTQKLSSIVQPNDCVMRFIRQSKTEGAWKSDTELCSKKGCISKSCPTLRKAVYEYFEVHWEHQHDCCATHSARR